MQNTAVSDWYEREVVELQSEIALLNRWLDAIHLLGKAHMDSHAHGMGTPTPQRTPRAKHTPNARRETPTIAAHQVTPYDTPIRPSRTTSL